MPRRTLNPHSLLVFAVMAMAVGALGPMRVTGWTGWFRGPLMTVIAPIAGPMNSLATWLRPGESRRGEDDATTSELRQQVEFFKSELMRTEQQNEQLRQVIEGLQGGVAYGPPLRLKRVEASRNRRVRSSCRPTRSAARRSSRRPASPVTGWARSTA